MKKRFFVIFLVLSIMLSAFASAAINAPSAIDIKAEAVNNQIKDLEKGYAEFNIKITNKGEEPDTFKLLYLDPPNWYAQVLPGPSAREITVDPGETGTIHVLVKPSVLTKGTYGIRALIQSLGSKIIYDDAVLTVKVGDVKTMPAADFDVDVTVPSQMDPRGTYTVLVTVKNNNERLLEDVSVRLSSNLISEFTNVTVNPNETKTVSFAVLLVDNIKPQQDQLYVNVGYHGKVFYDENHNYEVVEYIPPFSTDITVDKKFLRQEREIMITNDGNVAKSDVVLLQTSLKERFFSWADPKFRTVKSNGKYYFAWDVSLAPDESAEIKLTTSYRLLLLLALILIVLLAYKISTSNPLIVKKKITAIQRHGEAVSEFSVVIYLKNRSKEPISKLRVVERVSRMVRLKQDSFTGSMHPVKMHSHEREGTLLEYRFGELAAGDERIIKYRVYSALHIFGNVTIKPTVVEFFKKNNAKRKSKSNSVFVDTEAPAKEKPKAFQPQHHQRKN